MFRISPPKMTQRTMTTAPQDRLLPLWRQYARAQVGVSASCRLTKAAAPPPFAALQKGNLTAEAIGLKMAGDILETASRETGMSDEEDDDNDIVNQLAYVRADPTQHDTLTLLTMIDAALAEIMGLRARLRLSEERNGGSRQLQ
jgi:hypothetical protein